MSRETIVPAIPDIRSDNEQAVLSAIKNTIDVREGRIGDPLDQFATLRDLKDIGVVITGGTSTLTSGAKVPVVNPGVVGNDGYDPSADLTTPPAPSGLVATAGFANVYLSWTGAEYRNHAYTEIWRATTDNIGVAVKVGTSTTNLYADAALEATTYYYWIRFVSVANVTGPYNSTKGTSATTATNPGPVLSLLTGQITESQLYQSLNTRINLIDAPATTSGSVAARIAVVQGQVNDLLNTPTYSSTTTYPSGETVQYNGSLYQSLGMTTGNAPTNTTYWKKIGDYSSLGDAVAAHTTQISNLQTGLGQEISDRTLLSTQVTGGYTGTDLTQLSAGLLYQERQARSSADSSLASSISTLTATVNGNLASTNAAIATEQTTRANADSSLSTQISTLSSTVNTNYSTLNSTIGNEATTRSTADTALSNSITQLTASFQATQLGLPLTQWNLNNQTIATVTDGMVGTQVLRLSTLINAFPNQGTYVAIDSTKQYRVRFWARPSVDANGALYFSLRQFTNNTGTACATNNGRSPYKPGPVAAATHNAQFGAQAWGEYSFIWSASDWQAGAKFVEPEFLNNWGGSAGYWEIQDFGFTEVTAIQNNAAAIQTEATTRAAADASLSSLITSLTSTVNTNYFNLNSAITTEQTTRSTADTSLANSISALSSTVSGNYSTLSGSISSEASTRATADTALSNSITTLSSTVTGNYNTLNSAIQSEQSTRASADSALSSSITTLQSTVNNNYAALQTEATTRANADNSLYAQYTVKIDTNGHVSGFGLASSTANGTPTSAFIVRADRFAIAGPSDTTDPLGTLTPSRLPFIVTTTPTTVNGKVYPSGTWIDTAFIANATITSAQIGSVTADTITSGTLTAAISVNTGYIYGGISPNGYALGTAYTGTGYFLGAYNGTNQFFIGSPSQNLLWDGSNLTVKGVVYATAGNIGGNIITSAGITSLGYSAGSSGWGAFSNGYAEFNNVTVRGTVYATGGSFSGSLAVKSATTGARTEISNSVIKVYDSNGTLRVQIGDLTA
jgi:hypothetical protein